VLDGWLEVKKLIEEDIEEATGYRRSVCPDQVYLLLMFVS